MSAQATPLHPRFKLWLSSDEAEGVFGDGKWRLLAAVDREGSLKAASQSLRISYRKAWGDLRKAEDCLEVGFLEKRRGGSGGGESRLTDAGKKWLEAYSTFRAEVERAAAAAFETHIKGLVTGGGRE